MWRERARSLLENFFDELLRKAPARASSYNRQQSCEF